MRTALISATAVMLALVWGAGAAVAASNINFSIQSKDVVPLTGLDTPTPFTLSVLVTNDAAMSYTGFDVGVFFSPAIPYGQVKLTGISFPSSPGGSGSVFPYIAGTDPANTGIPADGFVTDSLGVDWSRSTALTLPVAATPLELIRFELELEPGADLAKWQVQFNTEFAFFVNGSSDANASYTYTNGYIATPEPASVAVLSVIALGLLRRRTRV